MTRRLFGTDGIRGTANIEPMTAETALRAAMATALQFRRGRHRHRVVIGKDTRLSGYLIEPALTAGFVSMGMDVILVGPLPTPAVAMLTRSLRCDIGVVVSASHNPFQDNGIKLFGPDGYKLSDEVEASIEARMGFPFADDLPDAAELGRASRLDDAIGRYIEYVKNTFPRGNTLEGLRVVVDCANGAAYRVAPKVLWELGAEVIPVGVTPDGTNINRGCGATDTRMLQEQVLFHNAHLGVALDGDADRLILVDEHGERVDGDQVMALIALSAKAEGRLKGDGVVATIMSNLGLERCLNANGLNLVRTPVGDRYVVERMREDGYNVGGEQSGHIILADHSTTGDGLIAALQVLTALRAGDRPASEVCRVFVPVPQLLKNVRFGAGLKPLETEEVERAVAAGRARLGDSGRLVIRPSGTEPVIRVMAEGDDEGTVNGVVDEVVAAVRRVSQADIPVV